MPKSTLYREVIINGAVIALLGALAVVLWVNRNFFYLPNIDIYQYICDARDYYNGRFPPHVQPQPLYSWLIYPVAFGFKNNSFPEIKAGVAINLMATLAYVWGMFQLAKRYLKPLTQILFLLVLVLHPLTFYSAVNTTPEPLLLAFIVFSILCYRSKRNLAYVFAMFAALVKYEGFILLGMYVLDVIAQHKDSLLSAKVGNIVKSNWGLALGIFIMGLWSAVTMSHNYSDQGFANYYITEIVSAGEQLPDYRKLDILLQLFLADNILFSTDYGGFSWFITGLLLLLLGTTFNQAWKQNHREVLLSMGFAVGYLLIHVSFPAYNPRYFLPLLCFLAFFVFYLVEERLSQKQKQKRVVYGVMILLFICWFTDIARFKHEAFLRKDKYLEAERRMAGEWFNSLQTERKVLVAAPDAQSLSYHLDGSSIKFPDYNLTRLPRCGVDTMVINSFGASMQFLNLSPKDLKSCQHLSCTLEDFGFEDQEIYLVESSNDNYKLSQNVISPPCLNPVKHLTLENKSVQIYAIKVETCYQGKFEL